MKITTKQISYCAVLAAIAVVLGYVSLGTNNFKVSIESLAILTGAVTLGPVSGLLVGGVSQFIYQLIAYGIDITTPLWLLPYAADGLVAGLIVKKEMGNISTKRMITAIIAGEITLTVLITIVNGASAVIQGWGSWAMIVAGIPLRLAIMAVRITIYCIVLPLLYKSLKKVVK